jgi:hypothetical protein
MEVTMRPAVIAFFAVGACGTVNAQPPKDANKDAKPAIKVLADGFPSGHATPEGVACDLARAFVKRDARVFEEACIKPFTQGKSREEYEAFLKSTVAEIKKEAEKKEPSPGGPKAIAKLFAARRLTVNGPVSYGWAAFGFEDVKFVDVGVTLHNGKRYLNRTLVIKDAKGKWYAHPLPGSSPLLSMGLNDESDSKTDFAEVYRVEK